MRRIPLGEQEYCAREETGPRRSQCLNYNKLLYSNLLKDSKEQATHQESSKALHKSGAGHDYAPRGHNEANPMRRPLEAHQYCVRWNLEQNIRNEKEHVGEVVVGALHA